MSNLRLNEMKMIAKTITAVSLVALSASAFAAEQLSASQLDGVTAGWGVANTNEFVFAAGGNPATTSGNLVTAGVFHTGAISQSAAGQSSVFTGTSLAGANAAGGTLSPSILNYGDTYSSTAAYVSPGSATATASQTSILVGPGVAGSTSSAGVLVSPF
jgi:hypothetical protein